MEDLLPCCLPLIGVKMCLSVLSSWALVSVEVMVTSCDLILWGDVSLSAQGLASILSRLANLMTLLSQKKKCDNMFSCSSPSLFLPLSCTQTHTHTHTNTSIIYLLVLFPPLLHYLSACVFECLISESFTTTLLPWLHDFSFLAITSCNKQLNFSIHLALH